jgi:hypothetical protein
VGLEERVLKALEVIQDCASFVIEVAEEKGLADYRADRLFRQAIERIERSMKITPRLASGSVGRPRPRRG